MSDILAVIPAWTGSRRIPRKVMQILGGETLLHRTIRFADDMGFDIIVTTDSATVANHAHLYSAGSMQTIVSTKHDGTSVGSNTVWREAWREQLDHSISILLEVDCPFREPDDVQFCVNLLERRDHHHDFVATVTGIKTVAGPATKFNGACYAARDTNIPMPGPEWYPIFTDQRLQIDTPQDLQLARMLAR